MSLLTVLYKSFGSFGIYGMDTEVTILKKKNYSIIVSPTFYFYEDLRIITVQTYIIWPT